MKLISATGVSGLGRFRANIFQQRNSVGIVARVIPDNIRNFSELGLPPVLTEIADSERGLILVTGTAGMGKSTTLSAIVDHINRTRSAHIITIEDPIEVLHKDKKSFVTQREVDVDTRNYADAVRGAMRQDPDVILIGELKDMETIEMALTAAETGQLVLATMSSFDAKETLSKLITTFPIYQQRSIRIQLAGVLKAIISQRLMKSIKGDSRVPAVEILTSTPLIRDCLLDEEKMSQLKESITSETAQFGMQTYDQSLFYLYQSGLIDLDEALRGSSNPNEFRIRLAGIPSGAKADNEGGADKVEKLVAHN